MVDKQFWTCFFLAKLPNHQTCFERLGKNRVFYGILKKALADRTCNTITHQPPCHQPCQNKEKEYKLQSCQVQTANSKIANNRSYTTNVQTTNSHASVNCWFFPKCFAPFTLKFGSQIKWWPTHRCSSSPWLEFMIVPQFEHLRLIEQNGWMYQNYCSFLSAPISMKRHHLSIENTERERESDGERERQIDSGR